MYPSPVVNIEFDVKVVAPVPPFPTGRAPVTSSVKSTPPDFMLIAPDDAAKLSELKLATPLLDVLASSAEYVTCFTVPLRELIATSIPSPVKNCVV